MMIGDYYYCQECDLAYRFSDTDHYYAPGFPSETGARGCPVDGSKLSLIDESEIDPSIFDYQGARP